METVLAVQAHCKTWTSNVQLKTERGISCAACHLTAGLAAELALAIIEGLDHGLEKGGGGGAVDDPMVEGQA